MNFKTPADFTEHEQWLAYVRENIPEGEQPYVLAYGRTELFKRFYAVRSRSLDIELTQELEHTVTLVEPERTRRLEELNKRILADITSFLLDQTKQNSVHSNGLMPTSSRERIEELLAYLTETNLYFALWVTFKKAFTDHHSLDNWKQYLCQRPELKSEDDQAFAQAMAELDRILIYFHHQDLPLPKYFYERCWFLHHLRGAERMLQTRALLNTLTAEIETCVSA